MFYFATTLNLLVFIKPTCGTFDSYVEIEVVALHGK